jgi:hypothetical protein
MNKLSQFYKTPAEKQMLDAVRRFPTLFQNRTQVLVHWFLIIGNGMEWNNGRLCYCWPDKQRPRLDKESAAMLAINHGFSTLYPPSEYARIHQLKDAREDFKLLGLSLIDWLLKCKPSELATACRFVCPTMADTCKNELIAWKPILRRIKRECNA